MGENKYFNVADPPCEMEVGGRMVICRHYERCGVEGLACRQFLRYLQGAGKFSMKPRVPTAEIFRECGL